MLGAAVGNYRIDAKLGEGGMGAVYLAEHTLIGRKAAIKVLLPELSHNPEVVSRFFNEARSTAMLKHPGLVDIYDFGHLPDGSAYIVMEFLEGESLAARLQRQGAPPLGVICAIARQVAVAVGAAHGKGIVHRDLKPDNIFLVPDPEQPFGVRVKVLDFGIAKLGGVGTLTPTAKTRTGAVMGTPAYMSPEQCRGAGQVDHRTDVYSLGCIIFEMACGRPPFVKEGVGEIIAAQIYEAPPSPRAIDPSISPALEAVIMRALAKQPQARQQNMEQLRGEIDQLVTSPPPGYSGAVVVPGYSGPFAQPGASGPVPLLDSTGPVPLAPLPAQPSGPIVAAAAPGDAALVVPRRRGPGAVVAVVGGLVLVGGVVAALLSFHPWRSASVTVTASDVIPAAAAPAPVPAPAAAPATAPAAAKPARVRLRIESVPAGAEVYRAADGVLLGTSPTVVELSPSAGRAVFLLKHAGYRDGRAELPADRSGAVAVKLIKAPNVRPPSHPPRAVAPRPPAPPVKAPPAKAPTPTPPKPPVRRPVRDGVVNPFGGD